MNEFIRFGCSALSHCIVVWQICSDVLFHVFCLLDSGSHCSTQTNLEICDLPASAFRVLRFYWLVPSCQALFQS